MNFVHYLRIIIVIILFITRHKKKLGRKPRKRKSQSQEKTKKETTEIKTHFDNYKQGINRNYQRWIEFLYSVVKSQIRFLVQVESFIKYFANLK